MLKRLIKFLTGIFRKNPGYTYILTEELPDDLNRYILYLIHNEGFVWQSAMVCPCGCGKILQMNMSGDYYPSWKYILEKRGAITLHPSIDRITGCKSHFFLRKGKIIWC